VTRTFLQRLALFARGHYRWVFAAFTLLVVASVVLIYQLHFDTDVLNLLPKKDPVINAYLETLEEFGTFDYLMVTVAIPEGVPIEPYETFLDRLAPRVEALEEVESVEYRIGDLGELIEDFFPQSVLFLDEAGREDLARRLSDEGIRGRVEELRRQLATPQSLVLRDLIRLDPLGLAEVFMDRVEGGQGAMSMDWTSGYYLSQDRRLLLLLAKPTDTPQNIGFDKRLAAGVEAAIGATRDEWGKIAGDDPPALPEVRVGGAYISAMIDATLIQGDMTINMVTSMGLVLALFLFAFRRGSTLLYAFLPLVTGLALTFGFSSLVFGVLSSATSGTAALLIGLGIDFVIVSYGRFVEERQKGADLEGALTLTMGSSGRAVVVGAVTTAATFYAFTFTDFKGLRQMGILTGTGILFCMLAVILLLPALLAWSEDRHRRRESAPRIYVHSFGTDRLIRFSFHHPKPVLAVGLTLTVVCLAFAARLQFEDSWRNMRPAGNEGVEVEQQVAEHFGSEFDFMMLILSGQQLEALMERTEEVTRRAGELVEAGIFSGVSGVTSVVPPPSRQRQALAWLEAGRASGVTDPDRIMATFRQALADEGLREAPFERGMTLLTEALRPPGVVGLDALPAEDQSRRLLDRVLHKKGDVWKSVIYLYQPPEVYRQQAPPEALALVRELGPGAVLTGVNIINEIMRVRVRQDAWIAAGIGTFVVFLLLWADFRQLRAAIFALLPLLVGIVWMLGVMGAAGIIMNFMNIFVTTMIIGIGVDYGLHMVHRYREVRTSGETDPDGMVLESGLVETGNAIVIAALSTVAGFGSMSLSHYPALRSTGYTAILGAVATALVAVTLLPAYLSLRVKRHPVAPDQGGG